MWVFRRVSLTTMLKDTCRIIESKTYKNSLVSPMIASDPFLSSKTCLVFSRNSHSFVLVLTSRSVESNYVFCREHAFHKSGDFIILLLEHLSPYEECRTIFNVFLFEKGTKLTWFSPKSLKILPLDLTVKK